MFNYRPTRLTFSLHYRSISLTFLSSLSIYKSYFFLHYRPISLTFSCYYLHLYLCRVWTLHASRLFSMKEMTMHNILTGGNFLFYTPLPFDYLADNTLLASYFTSSSLDLPASPPINIDMGHSNWTH